MNRQLGYLGLWALMGCLAGGLSGTARADSLTANNIPYKDVRILDVKDGKLTFVTSTGNTIQKDLSAVSAITLDDEPALGAAEAAYAKQDWVAAAEAYQKTGETTRKQWLKAWCNNRLAEAGVKSNRYDLAASAKVGLILRGEVEAARAVKLAPPDKTSKYLTDALSRIEGAMDPKLSTAQRMALLEMRAEAQEARGDKEAAEKTREDIMATADPNSPAFKHFKALKVLTAAKADLQKKAWDSVLAAGEKNQDAFEEPADAAEMLLCMADARYGKAEQKNDQGEWKDASLEYMRVAGNYPGSDQAGQALLKTAQIVEKQLNDVKGAKALYEQIVTEFKGRPAGKQADEQLKRLAAAKPE